MASRRHLALIGGNGPQCLNLNVHSHMLVLDGVYRREGEGRLRFVPVPAPSSAELQGLVQRIAERLSLTEGGLVRCALKTAYRDGTTHVIFEPEDFIARLAGECGEAAAGDRQRALSRAPPQGDLFV